MKRLLPWLEAVAFFMESLDTTALNTAVPVIAQALAVALFSMKADLDQSSQATVLPKPTFAFSNAAKKKSGSVAKRGGILISSGEPMDHMTGRMSEKVSFCQFAPLAITAMFRLNRH